MLWNCVLVMLLVTVNFVFGYCETHHLNGKRVAGRLVFRLFGSVIVLATGVITLLALFSHVYDGTVELLLWFFKADGDPNPVYADIFTMLAFFVISFFMGWLARQSFLRGYRLVTKQRMYHRKYDCQLATRLDKNGREVTVLPIEEVRRVVRLDRQRRTRYLRFARIFNPEAVQAEWEACARRREDRRLGRKITVLLEEERTNELLVKINQRPQQQVAPIVTSPEVNRMPQGAVPATKPSKKMAVIHNAPVIKKAATSRREVLVQLPVPNSSLVEFRYVPAEEAESIVARAQAAALKAEAERVAEAAQSAINQVAAEQAAEAPEKTPVLTPEEQLQAVIKALADPHDRLIVELFLHDHPEFLAQALASEEVCCLSLVGEGAARHVEVIMKPIHLSSGVLPDRQANALA